MKMMFDRQIMDHTLLHSITTCCKYLTRVECPVADHKNLNGSISVSFGRRAINLVPMERFFHALSTFLPLLSSKMDTLAVIFKKRK